MKESKSHPLLLAQIPGVVVDWGRRNGHVGDRIGNHGFSSFEIGSKTLQFAKETIEEEKSLREKKRRMDNGNSKTPLLPSPLCFTHPENRGAEFLLYSH